MLACGLMTIVSANSFSIATAHADTLPTSTKSYYMYAIDGARMDNLGCRQGTALNTYPVGGSFRSILDLGDMGFSSALNSYTFTLYGSTATTSQVVTAMEQYAGGVARCRSNTSVPFFFGIGTNNHGVVSTSAGYALSDVVSAVSTWIVNNGYSAKVQVRGALDMEVEWGSASVTRQMIDAFHARNANYFLEDFGDATGCGYSPPNPPSTNQTCYGTWTTNDVWYKAYGAPADYEVGEDYNELGHSADQWYVVSKYAYAAKGHAIDFDGVMTQYGACAGGCSGTDDTPTQGWNFMHNKLYSDAQTVDDLPVLTDIYRCVNTASTCP